jgi:hypothetical protein
MAKGNQKPVKALAPDPHRNQLMVLKAFSPPGNDFVLNGGSYRGQLDLSEISERSGLNDEKEVQRSLYILEGHKYVSPFPEGDFTSKTWFITKDGLKALRTLGKAAA